MVFVLANRGKPRITTMFIESDHARVDAALTAVIGDGGPVKEVRAWPTKLREKYYEELRKRGLRVTVVDNRQSRTESEG